MACGFLGDSSERGEISIKQMFLEFGHRMTIVEKGKKEKKKELYGCMWGVGPNQPLWSWTWQIARRWPERRGQTFHVKGTGGEGHDPETEDDSKCVQEKVSQGWTIVGVMPRGWLSLFLQVMVRSRDLDLNLGIFFLILEYELHLSRSSKCN